MTVSLTRLFTRTFGAIATLALLASLTDSAMAVEQKRKTARADRRVTEVRSKRPVSPAAGGVEASPGTKTAVQSPDTLASQSEQSSIRHPADTPRRERQRSFDSFIDRDSNGVDDRQELNRLSPNKPATRLRPTRLKGEEPAKGDSARKKTNDRTTQKPKRDYKKRP